MKVCLAAPSARKKLVTEDNECKYWLESFFSMQKWLIPVLKESEFFLLDSGAFSFMVGTKMKTTLDQYIDNYIQFINEYDIKHFFELDIDSIVGLDGVETIRKKIEKQTGKQVIPVWHKARGKDYFLKMCQEYPYVSIGGIVTKEITPPEYKYFHWFINTAHKYGSQIHGLGFTNTILLHEYQFDSVDSTAWMAGSRFGSAPEFVANRIVTHGQDKRPSSTFGQEIRAIEFNEWVKFQHYADKYL